ncbi:putative Patellin-4 [Tripterygium wilfordii]|uniref:Putative Patellin-4 n=1 Tax=Tripterygium wilfordii TaxID=458696 RepID=A0A7J7CHU8_TRIWF|nr:patellin-4-like [Tripterygium wilfordii]KAF5733611.1 putative Patellin-4 [Tripterygium wilfordii]
MTAEAVESRKAELMIPQDELKKVVAETEKSVEEVKKMDDSKTQKVQKSSSYREESNFLSDLKEFEKKALNELKAKLEEAILGNNLFKKEESKKNEKEKPVVEEEEKDNETKKGEESEKTGEEEAGKIEEEKSAGQENENAAKESEQEKPSIKVDEDICIWGVPLLPSKEAEATDVVLLKFLRAREFKVNDAFEMLKKTLQWRKDANIDSILDEDLGSDLSSVAYMNGVDLEGHPVCYNFFGVFEDEKLYTKTFGTEEKRSQFLRWRFQLMEKGIKELDMRPGGVTSLLQITDLKNSPGISKKDLRVSMKQVVGVLQDNYPEFVARNIFVNAPFWYHALNALLSPFLTQRTKSKFVVARPAKVTETLLKYISAEEIPVQYGGFKKENDLEFSKANDPVSELTIKAGSTETIEIPAAEVGSTLIWDLTVLNWEVNYKEEFVPNDEGSYTIIVQKKKKMGCNEGPIRNTFRNNEPGKIVLTIGNGSNKKKRVLYRYKIKNCLY